MINIEKIALVTGHKGSIFSLKGYGSDRFLSGGGEGWIVEWELSNPDPGRLLARVESNVFAIHNNGKEIVAGDMNGGIHWIDLEANETLDLQHHRRGIFDLWEDGGLIYALGGDGFISRRPKDEPRAVESVQLTHQSLRTYTYVDDRTITVGASDGCIYFVDIDTLEIQQRIDNAHDPSVFSLIYDASAGHLWSGGRDAQINIWSKDGKRLHNIPAHMFTVNDLTFNTDKSLVISGSRDKTIKVWDAKSFQLLKVIEGIRDGGHLNSVNCLLWCPDQNYLISGSDDNSIGIWKIEKVNNDII